MGIERCASKMPAEHLTFARTFLHGTDQVAHLDRRFQKVRSSR